MRLAVLAWVSWAVSLGLLTTMIVIDAAPEWVYNLLLIGACVFALAPVAVLHVAAHGGLRRRR